jgi:hypothetical protein
MDNPWRLGMSQAPATFGCLVEEKAAREGAMRARGRKGVTVFFGTVVTRPSRPCLMLSS